MVLMGDLVSVDRSDDLPSDLRCSRDGVSLGSCVDELIEVAGEVGDGEPQVDQVATLSTLEQCPDLRGYQLLDRER
jgi:hypothetical protein